MGTVLAGIEYCPLMRASLLLVVVFLITSVRCVGTSGDSTEVPLISCGEAEVVQWNQTRLQAELGNDCTHYLGSIHISDTGLLTVEVLSSLIQIDGRLSFFRNESMRSMDGLESLKRVGGGFSISQDVEIQNIDALFGLEEIGGDVSIALILVHQSVLESWVAQVSIGGSIDVQGNQER